MDTMIHRFAIGAFDCAVVNDGWLAYGEPGETLFANVPHDQLAAALVKYNTVLDEWGTWISPLPCLVIWAGGRIVLVDTGLGQQDFAPDGGKLLANLALVGIRPQDVYAIILTHAHVDHIGGNTAAHGQAAFPNARYFMRREEWEFWTAPETLANPEHSWMGEFVDHYMLPITDRFTLLEQDTEIVPGIRTLFAPGHTPGHTAVEISSGGEKLICLGDAIAHPVHCAQPGWNMSPDCDWEQNVQTRKLLLEQAANEHARVFAFHMDFPGTGYIHRQGAAWRWQPVPG